MSEAAGRKAWLLAVDRAPRGADERAHFVAKPFDPRTLLARVRAALDGSD